MRKPCALDNTGSAIIRRHFQEAGAEVGGERHHNFLVGEGVGHFGAKGQRRDPADFFQLQVEEAEISALIHQVRVVSSAANFIDARAERRGPAGIRAVFD